MTIAMPHPHTPAVGLPSRLTCPGCDCSATVCFYRLERQPVHVGITYATVDSARHAPVGDIDLHHCGACGLVFNAAYDPTKLDYRPGYDASLVHSPLFHRFLDSIIDRLIDRHDLSGKTVLEIGCGAGHFLRRLCSRAGCHGVGVDPTVPREDVERVGETAIRWVRSLYDERCADLPCDLLCCLDVFEQIPRPLGFLRMVCQTLGAGGTPVYFECPDRGHVFSSGAGWSVYYEQCSHFDVPAIRGLFERAGFEVTDASRCEANPQCLQVEAISAAPEDEADCTAEQEPGLPSPLAAFAEAQRERVAMWGQRLRAWSDEGRRAVLWGSGGKGVNFLNTVPDAERIEYVVDVNPTRHGRYLPRGGQRIVPLTFLREHRPGVVIVSNPLWHAEVAAQIVELDLDCELIDA